MMPEALEAVFHEFTSSSEKLELSKQEQQYQYIAADGSTTSFFSFSKYSSDDYFISEGHSASGFYSIHINAFYDINKRIYTDAILQSAHKKMSSLLLPACRQTYPSPGSKNYFYRGQRVLLL
ncbi:MAG: hypothetical protein ACLTS6_10315 [Anaerobutyricum sp.]